MFAASLGECVLMISWDSGIQILQVGLEMGVYSEHYIGTLTSDLVVFGVVAPKI